MPTASNKPIPCHDQDQAQRGRIAQGESSAFDELVGCHHDEIAQLVYRLLAWDSEAEDVVQEVFLAAWRALPSFRGELIDHQVLPESVSDVVSALAMELINVEVELYGSQGRVKAIERAIAAQAARSQKATDRDEVLAKLTEIVGIRQSALAHMRKKAAGSDAELLRAHADLAEAQLSVATRKNELAVADGAASLATLNEQLRKTTIDIAELEAQREYISKKLETVRPLIELGIKHDQIAESDLQRAERRVREVEGKLQLARDKADQVR